MLILDLDKSQRAQLAAAVASYRALLLERGAPEQRWLTEIQRLFESTRGQDGSNSGGGVAEFVDWLHGGRMLTMLTVSDAANELNVSVSTAKRLIASGALRSVVIAGTRRVHRDDFNAYVNELRSPRNFRDEITTKETA